MKEQAFFYKPTNFKSFWSKNKNFPKFLARPCILTPSEYSFWENPIFIQFIITPKQIVVSFYFFFQEKQTAFVNILSPYTPFLMTHSSCCDVIKLRHIRPGGILRPGWKWRTQKLLISAKGEELKVWKLF